MPQVAFNGDFQVGSLSTETVKIDLSTKIKSVKLSRNGETIDVTTFNNASKQYAKALMDADLDVQIFYDSTVWLHMQNLLSSLVQANWQYGPEGTTTGNRKVTGTSTSGGLFLTSVEDETAVGQVKMLNCKFKLSGTPTLGVY